MRTFKLSEAVAARRDLFVVMVSAVDHVTPAAGLTLTVELCKAAATDFTDITAGVTVDELSNGAYRLALAAAHLDTEGAGLLRVTATGADPQFIPIGVESDWLGNRWR